MKIKDIKVGILRIEGTNCEQESYDSFKKLGANPEFVHLKQLLGMDCNKDEKRNIFDYQCLMIPGGFTHVFLSQTIQGIIYTSASDFMLQHEDFN